METRVAIENFLENGRAKGLSPQTLRFYRDCLGKLAAQYCELPMDPRPLRQFLGDLTCGNIRRQGYYRAFRTFYHFLERDQEGLVSPLRKVERPRAQRRIPRTLELGELIWLLAAARDDREKALITLLMDTGVRVGEAANLRLDDVGRQTIFVSGKSGEREVPTSEETLRLLERIACRGVVFHGQRGPMTGQGLYKMVRRCFQRAGLSGRRSSPHTLRHSFARHYIAAGGDAFSLQKILGHRDMATVRLYVDLWGHDLVLAHSRYTPLKQLQGAAQLRMEDTDVRNKIAHNPVAAGPEV